MSFHGDMTPRSNSNADVTNSAFSLADANVPDIATACYSEIIYFLMKQVFPQILNLCELFLSMLNNVEEMNSVLIQFYNRVPKTYLIDSLRNFLGPNISTFDNNVETF